MDKVLINRPRPPEPTPDNYFRIYNNSDNNKSKKKSCIIL